MIYRSDDEEFSVMESLDPQPPPPGGLVRAREVLLGLLLLFGVLGWAGWQTWRQEAMRNEYERGLSAEERKDWDEARARFSAAGNYKDAASRATELARLIDRRDLRYDAAVSSASRGDWAEALEAAQEVRGIQPGYSDTAKLEAEARPHVYREALPGVLALRTEANPPGIYYGTAEGWMWLHGSDRWSRIQNNLAGDLRYMVYDVPAEGWAPPNSRPTPYRNDIVSGSPGMRGRQLVVADWQRAAEGVLPLALDPADYNQYVAGARGIWALRYNPFYNGSLGRPINAPGPEEYTIAYQPYTSSVTTTVGFGGSYWAIADFGPGGDRLLLADWDAPYRMSTTVRIHTAGPTGGNRRLIYTHKGEVVSAQFSLDGRFALINTSMLTASVPTGSRSVQTRHALVLVDLQAGGEPVRILERTAGASRRPLAPVQVFGAAFLGSGSFAGMLLVLERTRFGNVLRLIDPQRPTAQHVVVGLGDVEDSMAYAVELPGEGLLVALQRSWGQTGTQNPLTVALIRPDMTSVVSKLPEEMYGFSPVPWIRDGKLIYDAENDLPTRPTTGTVYSLPLSDLGIDGVRTTEVYTYTAPSDEPFPATSWQPGPGLLVYSENGDLHARSYDGASDATLEPGVPLLFDLQSYVSFRLLR